MFNNVPWSFWRAAARDARAQKRTSAAASIFNNSTLLKQIFAWIGPGHHLFLATVCTEWQRQQQTVDVALKEKMLRHHYEVREVLCKPLTTLYSAVFASKALLRTAQAARLPLTRLDGRLHYAAGKAADLGTLHLAHELGLELNNEVLRGAAASASLPKLGWLHTIMHYELPDDICRYAASSGSVDVLNWLMRRGCTLDSGAYTYAAEYDQWDMLKVLRAEGLEWGFSWLRPRSGQAPCSIAIEKGNLEAVRWLYENGCPQSSRHLGELGAEGGSIEALRYAKEQGCVYEASMMERAAEGGHVSAVEHLYAEECPLPADTLACSSAFLANEVGALRWLHEHGCPWDVDDSCKRAAQQGQPDTLAYMLEHAEPLPAAQLTELLFIAGCHKHLTVAQLLRQHGAQWPPVLRIEQGRDKKCWNAAIVAWARSEGCTSPDSTEQ
jgi:hypothetical protein